MAPTEQQQALLVPRESMIARLEERRQEAEDARKKAEAEISARRQEALEAVKKLTPDQLVNFIDYQIGSLGNEGVVKWVEEAVETERFVSQDLKPTGVETQLEKLLRVLKLATNKEIEVYPTDPLYSYI